MWHSVSADKQDSCADLEFKERPYFRTEGILGREEFSIASVLVATSSLFQFMNHMGEES